MKQHLERIAACNETIRTSEAKVAHVQSEREKHRRALDAATAEHNELRDKASRALALAAIGDGDEAEARKLDDKANTAAAKVQALSRTMTGFDEIEQQHATLAADARAERGAAHHAAFQAYVETLGPEYLRIAREFIAISRRAHALEWIGRAVTGNSRYSIFPLGHLASEMRIPALNLPLFESERRGPHKADLYSTTWDAQDMRQESRRDDCALQQAINAERAALAKAGLAL